MTLLDAGHCLTLKCMTITHASLALVVPFYGPLPVAPSARLSCILPLCLDPSDLYEPSLTLYSGPEEMVDPRMVPSPSVGHLQLPSASPLLSRRPQRIMQFNPPPLLRALRMRPARHMSCPPHDTQGRSSLTSTAHKNRPTMCPTFLPQVGILGK
jgi:hypothetical protein